MVVVIVNEETMSDKNWFDLVNEVHDQYFDLDGVKFDSVSGEFRLPFGSNRKEPYNERELVS